MLIVKLLIDQEITHLLACIAWIFFRCATVFSCITSLLNLSWHVYFLALHFTREPHLICTAGTSTYPGQSDWTLFNPWLSRGKKGFKFVKLIYTVNTIIQLYLTCLNVCLRKWLTFHDATTGFHLKLHLTNEHRNSLLMMPHYYVGIASDWLKQISPHGTTN